MNYITTGSELTSIANAIREKGGTTEPLTYPSEFVSAIEAIPTGGDQPMLFAPVITGGVNEISWENNSSNGDFEVTIAATVDGNTVTSPLTITEQMDGKTLVIIASAENFESVTSTILLEYMSPTNSLFAISLQNAVFPVREGFVFWLDGISSLGYFNIDQQTVNNAYIYVSSGGNTQDTTITQAFSFVATTDGTNYVDLRRRRGKFTSELPLGGSAAYNSPESGTWSNSVTVTITMYDTTANVEKFSKTYTASNYYNNYQSDNIPLEQGPITAGHTYTFIVNATITALA